MDEGQKSLIDKTGASPEAQPSTPKPVEQETQTERKGMWKDMEAIDKRLGTNAMQALDGKTEPAPKEEPEAELTERQKEIRANINNAQKAVLQMSTSGDSPILQAAFARQSEKELQDKEETRKDGLISAIWRDTTAAGGLMKTWERINTFAPDPSYDLEADLPNLTKDIPAQYHKEFASAQSAGEAAEIRQGILTNMETMQRASAQGWKGTAALLVGFADIDLPLMFLSGGTVGAAKAAALAGKLQRVAGMSAKAAELAARSAVAGGREAFWGAASGALAGTVASMTQPDMDSTDAVHLTLASTMFGGMAGGMLGAARKANTALKGTIEDWAKIFDDPYLKAYEKTTSTGKAFGNDPEEWAKFGKAVQEKAYGNLKDSPFLQAIHKRLGASSDFDALWLGKSDTARGLAYSVFESAAGVARGDRSASALLEDGFMRYSARPMMSYYDNYKMFCKERGAGFWERQWGGKVQDDFNRAVAEEMDRRWLGKPEGDVSPAVKQAADAWDEMTATVAKEARAAGVEGFETLPEHAGYMPRVLSGEKYIKMVAKHGEPAVKGLLKKSIMAGSQLDDETADIIAGAMLTRAKNKAKGMDMQVLNLTNGDSRAYIKEILMANKVGEERAQKIVDTLMAPRDESNKVKYGKHRVPMDLSTTEGGMSMMDLIDFNIPKVYAQYAKTMAGRTAMARKGISSMGKWNEIKAQILNEDPDILRGVNRALTGNMTSSDYLDELVAPFFGGAESKIHPLARTMKNMTTLGTMSMLGLPQLGETGAQIATVGLWNWCKNFPMIFKGVFGKGGKGSVREGLAHDFGWMTTELCSEYKFLRPDMQIEHLGNASKYDMDEVSKLLGTLDKVMGKGMNIQGHISGWNFVSEKQKEILMFTYLDKLMTGLKKNSFSRNEIERLLDEGFDPQTLTNIKGYIDKGIVQFTPNGKITNQCNFESWRPEDIESLRLGLRRVMYQNVQKGFIGETPLWLRGSTASVLMQFKSFPMMAIQKQTMRNMAFNDGRTYALTMYGLMTAGMAHSIRQYINGREDKLNADDVFTGAVSMSNMFGWLPMIVDPVASMTGMDCLMFDDHSPYAGVDVGLMPAYDVIRQQLKAPVALAKGIAFGDLSKEERVSVSRTWLVGNMMGARRFSEAVLSRNK